ncbi:LytR family transcriptional regulator [Clostridium polyendosporum]|uniref:LytR family transcriptional regulator n=1 Tax=Clostridium polyendosporum TaxID=69208 RepID=A0A919RZY4_9CLOT|nr:LCP family protein [Clostridium polyendosporum]GIM28723.1 LytR family transcriptional regulator [Clostridium polyendosporum]
MKKNKKILFIGILLIIATAMSLSYYFYKKINKVKYSPIQVSEDNLKINEKIERKSEEKKVTNILLLGIDKEELASDTIMVLSIDEKNDKIKLTSILRDSYINFREDKVNKINYAYHYGGPVESIKVINSNYNLDIKDFIKIDFTGLVQIIDLLGGVEININKEEIQYINSGLSKRDKNHKHKPVTTPGLQLLNGTEALAYSRIRSIDSDFNRTNRQRNVISSIYNKLKTSNSIQYPQLVSTATSYVETSLNSNELMILLNKILLMKDKNIKELRLPIDGTWQDSTINGVYYLQWDKEQNIKRLHEFIYGDS